MPPLGSSTFANLGGSVSDLFAGFGAITQADLKAQGLDIQAQGDLAEAKNYDLAADLAGKNVQFTEASTAIKQAQNDRQIYQKIGGQQADVAAGGFASSGSALDLMADSAAQGRLVKSVTEQQGLITEAGYQEQQQSYLTMSAAARATAAGLENIADQTRDAGTLTEIGDFISAGIKGVAAVATGGGSLAIGNLFMGGGSPTGFGSG